MRKTIIASLVSAAALTVVALGQTGPATQPASNQSTQQSPEQTLETMLKPSADAAKPLQPTLDAPQGDKTSGKYSKYNVAPKTPPMAVQREGTFIFDRTGRLSRNADGTQAEFTFESDGKTLKDPPVIILPNLKLMTMEDAVKATNRDLRFRVTGMLTEYRGRNYLLLEKVLVPPEGNAQF
jgi:hypothetical protein